MDIIKAYATKNDCYKTAQKMTPKGIVVHSTGCNNPYLKRYVDAPNEVGVNEYGNTWNNSGLDVCVHAFIGYDKNRKVRVANILPYNYCAWGVGSGSKGSYNFNPAYIQFEMCEDDLTNKAYYTAVIDKAVEYCAYLCKTYNISPDKICSHKEAHTMGYASDHGDPENWMSKFGDNMDKFRAKVRAKLNVSATSSSSSGNTKPTSSNKTLYRVRKSWSDAKSQKGAFKDLNNAKKCADSNKGYSVFDNNGKKVYPVSTTAQKEVKKGSVVKLRQGATTYMSTAKLADWCYKSKFTVMELKGNRAVIGIDGKVTAAVNKNDLIVQ
ncbi:MAG: peptidoglycan recognition family protein [Clostridia bacterium]|nr:peptidoglycan recognition family protein [Clostridia bacterium]